MKSSPKSSERSNPLAFWSYDLVDILLLLLHFLGPKLLSVVICIIILPTTKKEKYYQLNYAYYTDFIMWKSTKNFMSQTHEIQHHEYFTSLTGSLRGSDYVFFISISSGPHVCVCEIHAGMSDSLWPYGR